jgi:hypothetical protein
MTAPRRRLPNRRRSTTLDIEVAGLKYKATVSCFPDGSLAELFISNHKAGMPPTSPRAMPAFSSRSSCSTDAGSKRSPARFPDIPTARLPA